LESGRPGGGRGRGGGGPAPRCLAGWRVHWRSVHLRPTHQAQGAAGKYAARRRIRGW